MSRRHPQSLQRGMVLVSSLLLLVVVTILAIGLFRSFGLDEKIAGNTREKQRALQAAISAQQYAEWWLSVGNTISLVSCSGSYVSTTTVPLCTNTLPSAVVGGSAGIAVLPWLVSGVATQVSYTLPNTTIASGASITQGTYYSAPVFYISYLGAGTGSNGSPGILFQIDAAGYGGSPNTAAVVESTYLLQTADTPLDGT
jgi:type IV pilus assembly protein PilX